MADELVPVGEEAPQKKKSGLVMTIVGVLVLTLVGAGGGWFVGGMLAPSVSEAPVGAIGTVRVTIEEHRPPPPGRSRAPYRILTGDSTGDLTLVFFNPFAGALTLVALIALAGPASVPS